MAMQKCLYCNTGTLMHVKPSSDFYSMSDEKEGISSLPLGLYQCDTCGIQCTKLEVDKAGSSGRSPFSAARQPEVSEEKLVQAWNLMRKSDWEEALTVLFRAGSPLEHPLDFLFTSTFPPPTAGKSTQKSRSSMRRSNSATLSLIPYRRLRSPKSSQRLRIAYYP